MQPQGSAMKGFGGRKQRSRGSWVVVTGCVLIGLAAAGASAESQKQMIVLPSRDAKFIPFDPAHPEGPQFAVLSGDPKMGPVAVLLKLKKGSGPLHSHSADYHGMLIQGSARHWAQGQQEADAKVLDPGSYWFQPGGQVHGDACLSDECLIFASFEGRMDVTRAPAPRK